MGREIKFRAWNTQKKRMSYQDGTGSQPLIFRIDGALTLVDKYNNSEYQYKCEHNLFITDEEGGKYHTEDFLLMQHTGLKDKNGKEIYEGDIVAIIDKRKKDPFQDMSVVEWSEFDDYYGEYGGGIAFGWVFYLPPDTLTVIGNIYENPDLLSKFKKD